jgi:gentisate 1,2-dioxygenase
MSSDARGRRLPQSRKDDEMTMARVTAKSTRPAIADPQAAYAERIAAHALVPLWSFYREWFTGEPRIAAVPHRWSYAALRDLLLQSADVISAEEAERRVLVLENPGLAGRHLVTESLYAGLQLITPGEVAPAHRHTAVALRFIIEGEGAYTAVEGEKAYMAPGDFIVTPSWAWHDHAHEGREPMVWLDVLDVPLIRFLGPHFSERYGEQQVPERAPPQDSLHRYGANMLPESYRPGAKASPIFSYPYAKARETLERLKAHSEWDPCHGLKMQYIDPTTGGPAIPTISTFLQLLPMGFRGARYRSTEGAIYCVAEGHGRVVVTNTDGTEQRLDFAPRDVLALPCWTPYRFESDTETVLFEASDRATQQKLGIWREQR